MASYSYTNRANGINDRGRTGFRFQSGGAAYNGAEATSGLSNSNSALPTKATPSVLDCPPQNTNNGGNMKTYKEETTKAEEFISNVQNEASNEGRMGFPGMHQRQKFGNFNTSGISGGWSGPGNAQKNSVMNGASEHTLINTGGWVRPTRASWAMAPEGELGRATNDIGTAAEYLRESVRPLATMTETNRRSSPVFKVKKSAGSTIDSREAARKYGGQFI